MKRMKKKEPLTLLQGKEWVPSVMTDVRRTWEKFGWKPSKPKGVVTRPINR